MSTVDLLGWLAGSLVLSASCVKTMVPLRCIAITGNIAFIGYALMADALPILVLHTLLLPMNLLRLYQLGQLNRRSRRVSHAKAFFDLMAPHLPIRRFAQGSAQGSRRFNKGDHARAPYLVLRERVRIVESDAAYVSPESPAHCCAVRRKPGVAVAFEHPSPKHKPMGRFK